MSLDPKAIRAFDEQLVDDMNGAYNEALNRKDNYVNRFSREIRIDNNKVHLPFTYETLDWEEKAFGEAIQYKNILMEDVQMELKLWKVGAEIKEIEFGNMFNRNLLMDEVNSIGRKGALLPLKQMTTAMILGDTDPAYVLYDGKQFFATDHEIGLGDFVWSNLEAGALSTTTLNAAMTRLANVPLGPNGEYLETDGARFTLFVPPALELVAREILFNTQKPDATFNTENQLKGVADLIVENRFTDPDDWYVLMTVGNKLPFSTIRHANLDDGGRLHSLTDVDLKNRRDGDALQWFGKRYVDVFPTHPWLAIKYVN